MVKLADEDQKTRALMQAEGGCHIMTHPREDAQDHDIFISLTGALCVIVNSQKDKCKALKEHIMKDIVPRGFDARIEEIQEEHNQQTTQLQQAIADRDKKIRAI